MKQQIITAISNRRARKIIDSYKPLGLFIYYDKKQKVYIGIDNSSGEAYTEEFNQIRECLSWLRGSTKKETNCLT